MVPEDRGIRCFVGVMDPEQARWLAAALIAAADEAASRGSG